MSFYKTPREVMEILNCIFRNFMWEGQSERRKLDLVYWSECKIVWCFGLGKFNAGILGTVSKVVVEV